MKKSLSIIPLLLTGFMLAACTSAVYKENVEKGQRFLEEKDYKEAVSAFNAALKEKPNDEEAQKLLDEANHKLNEQKEIEGYIKEVNAAYDSLLVLSQNWDELREKSANGEVDDFTVAEILSTDFLSNNGELVKVIESIEPPNDEIKKTHEVLIDAVNKQQQAFIEIIAAVEGLDASKLTSANSLLAEVRKKDREFVSSMRDVVEKYNINENQID